MPLVGALKIKNLNKFCYGLYIVGMQASVSVFACDKYMRSHYSVH